MSFEAFDTRKMDDDIKKIRLEKMNKAVVKRVKYVENSKTLETLERLFETNYNNHITERNKKYEILFD